MIFSGSKNSVIYIHTVNEEIKYRNFVFQNVYNETKSDTKTPGVL